jgi:hypothetical protein
MTLLRITEDNDFYRIDEGWSRLPYFIIGIILLLLLLHIIENKK